MSLIMMDKAGVPRDKVAVGLSLYGRSFKMADKDCYGPQCHFTGSFTVSNARPGRCTKTYVSVTVSPYTQQTRRIADRRQQGGLHLQL
jgi:hypothetical protein